MTSFLISTLAPFILAGKQSCKTVLLPSLFITSCRRVSFHNNLGTLNYHYWRCAIARVRHKSTPMLLCRFRNAAFFCFISVDAFCILSVQARERSCKGLLMSTCVFSEIHSVKVKFWLVFLALTRVCCVSFS